MLLVRQEVRINRKKRYRLQGGAEDRAQAPWASGAVSIPQYQNTPWSLDFIVDRRLSAHLEKARLGGLPIAVVSYPINLMTSEMVPFH
jgi:hypothetical protein